MGDDSTSGRKLRPEPRAQQIVDQRQRVERNDARILKPGLEQIFAAEGGQGLDPGGAGGGFRFGDPRGVDVDAQRAGAAPGRRDADAPVAAAEIDKRSPGPAPARSSMRATAASGVGQNGASR